MNVPGGLDVRLLMDNIAGCLRLRLIVPSLFSALVKWNRKPQQHWNLSFRRQMRQRAAATRWGQGAGPAFSPPLD